MATLDEKKGLSLDTTPKHSSKVASENSINIFNRYSNENMNQHQFFQIDVKNTLNEGRSPTFNIKSTDRRSIESSQKNANSRNRDNHVDL